MLFTIFITGIYWALALCHCANHSIVYLFNFGFWPHRTACRILVPQPGMEAQVLGSEITES